MQSHFLLNKYALQSNNLHKTFEITFNNIDRVFRLEMHKQFQNRSITHEIVVNNNKYYNWKPKMKLLELLLIGLIQFYNENVQMKPWQLFS